MSDCIDALIDANFVAALKTISVGATYNTDIGTVERARTVLSINNRYPYTLVIQMEPDEVEQWACLRNDNLNYLVWYLDGINDQNETVNREFTYRLRNVAADVAKALRADPSRGGYAQNTKIQKSGFGFLPISEEVLEPGVYVLVEIERILDPNDPYKLAP
jgi:hypothetical protein